MKFRLKIRLRKFHIWFIVHRFYSFYFSARHLRACRAERWETIKWYGRLTWFVMSKENARKLALENS